MLAERWLRDAPAVRYEDGPYRDGDPGQAEPAVAVFARQAVGRTVEVGAGAGRYTRCLDDPVATDVSHERLRRAPGLRVVCDAARLPFRDHSIDSAFSFHVMEHMTEPRGVLAEMARVARYRVLVGGPNMLSPLYPARAALGHLRRGHWLRSDTRGPWGGTVLSSAWIAVRNIAATTATYLAPSLIIDRYRVPDMRPPAHGDTDAVWLTNPTTVARLLRREGMTVVATRGPSRVRVGRYSGSYGIVVAHHDTA